MKDKLREKGTILQAALDLKGLDKALEVGNRAARGGAHWLEAGTPLIKSEGMKAVRELSRVFPDKKIVADLKTLDTGFLEVEMAAQAGANVLGIAGVADLETVNGAVKAARDYNVILMADLIAVDNLLQRAQKLEEAGVDVIEHHTSIDKQKGGDSIAFDQLEELTSNLKVPVAVAGGLDQKTAKKAKENGARIFIVGGAINGADNPEQATREILEAL